MWLSARVDYAVRAMLELAAGDGTPIPIHTIAAAQDIPPGFLENIVGDLRRAGLVVAKRGRAGGLVLSRPAAEITIADLIRAETGNLADIHGLRPEEATYEGAAAHLTDVWVAARAAYRSVLEAVTLADVVAGQLPPDVVQLAADPRAWASYPQL